MKGLVGNSRTVATRSYILLSGHWFQVQIHYNILHQVLSSYIYCCVIWCSLEYCVCVLNMMITLSPYFRLKPGDSPPRSEQEQTLWVTKLLIKVSMIVGTRRISPHPHTSVCCVLWVMFFVFNQLFSIVFGRYLFERIDGRVRGNIMRQAAIDRFSKPGRYSVHSHYKYWFPCCQM